jgi:hypothetical protein
MKPITAIKYDDKTKKLLLNIPNKNKGNKINKKK